MKRRTVAAAEYDVVDRYWRKMYCYLQRAGVTSGIKRQMRRRERREAREEVRTERGTASARNGPGDQHPRPD